MTRCYGTNCPLANDCYRFTYPYYGKNFFTKIYYNETTNTCEYFITNIPTEQLIKDMAYYIWLNAGKPSGNDLDIWLEAKKYCYASYGRSIEI